MNIKDIIIYLVLAILIYKQFLVSEKMNNDEISKKISEIYKADVNAIRNLSKLSNDLTKNRKLKVPGGLEVDGPFNIIPRGCILAWNGTTAPSGWAICDGTNGTPDLRGRFIRMATLNLPKNGNNTYTYHKYTVAQKSGVDKNIDTNKRGSNDSYIQNHKFNEKGGTDWRTLHINEMPKHNHSGSTSSNGNHTHSLGKYPVAGWPSKKVAAGCSIMGSNSHCNTGEYRTSESAGNHSHTISNSGSSWGFGTVPPYYVLTYIMKL